MPLPEIHPAAAIFPLLNDAELQALAEDIRTNGLREPVWLHADGRLIDGRNRWRACERIGLMPESRVYRGDDADVVAFVVSLNLHRRHLNESQRAMVAARIATLGRGGDRGNQFTGGKAPIGGMPQPKAAELLNVGERSVQRAREVQQSGAPELVEAVERGEVAVSTAAVIAQEPPQVQREVVQLSDREIVQRAKQIQQRHRDERLREKAARVAEIAAAEPVPFDGLGPFPVLYADPPWRYDFAESSTRQIENQYPTMSLDEIKALDVPAADDGVLFLWATSPKLPEALEVMAAWGFTYVTSMVWVKDKIGMGYYARQQHELLLIGKRGALPVPDPEDRPPSVLTAPRGEHSAKPDEAYRLIERMYPFAEKCELFQRRPRDRWAGWGNQAAAS